MRKLGSALGVAPMALYRYVTNKEEIFELMADAVMQGIAAPPDITHWKDVARHHMWTVRKVMLAHPWLLEVAGRIPFDLVPSRMEMSERALVSINDLDLDPDTARAVLATVASWAWGAVAAEVGLQSFMHRRGWNSPNELRDALSGQMAYLMETGRYPTFHSHILNAKRKDDAEWLYDFGLESVLEGISIRLNI